MAHRRPSNLVVLTRYEAYTHGLHWDNVNYKMLPPPKWWHDPGLYIEHLFTLLRERRWTYDPHQFHTKPIAVPNSPPRCPICFAPLGSCHHGKPPAETSTLLPNWRDKL